MTKRKGVAAFAVTVVVLAGCSSSGHKSLSTSTTTTGGATTTTVPTAATATPSTTSGSAVTPTTNAGAPATNGSPAVSASFVSLSDGFAVERSGQVDGTTNGGRTWHRVGAVASPGPDEVIRFIDAADGFAFSRNSGPLMITHDGGATWTPVSNAPFSTVADLAIARGTIYAVALSSGSTVNFRIWSTPVAHLVWKLDPLSLPVGAGPVPEEQIVLAGGQGWILNVDRTVISGARLTAGGTWARWTPPCATYGGTASFAASTATDLVAICNPGPGTQAPLEMTTSAEFSHNGGTTFDSHAIPGAKFGVAGPLSPTADTAVIVDGSVLRLTTDGGASWRVVARATAGATGGTTDYGFTSTTQGFAIVDGYLLMTYDAGATWQSATLP